MFKNVASQKVTVFAFDATTGLPKTGDAANLTAYVSKDDGSVTVLGDTSATEQDATNAKGYYIFDLTQAETNADKLMFSCKSSTSDIVVLGVPAVVFTVPASWSMGLSAAAVQSIWDALTSALATANSIGKLLVDNINATISSRLASASYTAPPSAAQNATELLDQAAGIETNRTVRQGLRLMLAALAGILNGAATATVTIRDTNDTKDRIVATTDGNGNRTSVTLDAS